MSIGLYLLRDQAASVASDIRRRSGSELLRIALAHHFDSSPADWRLGRADSGARVVRDGPLPLPAVSLTHTGDLIVAAVTAGCAGSRAENQDESTSIGVDAERPGPRRYAAIARHLGWPSSLWAKSGAPTQDEFLHLWTLWEALFKSMPSAAFVDVRRVFVSEIGQVSAGSAGVLQGETWSAHSWQCPDRYWLSLVVRFGQASALRLFRVDRPAGDVESARIKKITVTEDKFHF